MKTVMFDPNRGPLSVNVACGYAQTGSYTIYSWKGKEASQVGRGNFMDPSDDRFDLPGDAADYDGQILECIATIALIPPIKEYSVMMEVMQGGQRIGFDLAVGELDDVAVTRSVFIMLRAGGSE